MKAEFGACPAPYKVERIGEHSAKITFAENAVEIEHGRWRADIYELTTAYTPNIDERIESNYNAWIGRAKEATIEEYNAKQAISIEDRTSAIESALIDLILGGMT